jgi:hypothetical protein
MKGKLHKMAFRTPAIHSPYETQLKKTDELRQAQQAWSAKMRYELRWFGSTLWPKRRLLKWFRLPSYRMRHQLLGDQATWWIERDIPPVDRFRCAAYLVHLRLDSRMGIVMSVESGERTIPVIPLSAANLRAALLQAGADRPLIIPRQMGDALDP